MGNTEESCFWENNLYKCVKSSTIHWVETRRHSSKKNVPDQKVSKEGHADSLLGKEKNYHNVFRCEKIAFSIANSFGTIHLIYIYIHTSVSIHSWQTYILGLFYIYIDIYIYISSARISLTLSRHSSLSFIASGRPSRLHPVSSQSCCM